VVEKNWQERNQFEAPNDMFLSPISVFMSYWQVKVRLAQEMIIRHYNIFELTFKCLIIMSKVNIQPLADRVLVEPAAAEEKTASGLFIPDTAKEKPQKGTVVAVGNGKKDEPLTVKVGDTVLYGKYAGTELSVDGHDYLIMREADIFAIL
jgi:chaperonin GroES